MRITPFHDSKLLLLLLLLRTVLKQTARIDVHGVPLLGEALERIWLSQYETSITNVSRVLLGINFMRGGQKGTNFPCLYHFSIEKR